MNIGFIGLGMMGLSIASNLAKAGYPVAAYDIKPGAGESISGKVRLASSPADAGKDADIVFLSLPGPAEIEAACLSDTGLIQTMKAGAVVIDLSTNSMDLVKKLFAEFAKKDIDFLEAPVSGGPWGAADATLAIWAGGKKEAFERAEPALHAIGKRVKFMGAIGNGTLTKLVHNTGANIRAGFLAEIMNLGIKGGIDPVDLLEAIRQGSHGRTRTFDFAAGKMLDGTYDEPFFKLKLGHKDLKLAVALGEELGVPMRLATVVLGDMDEAMARGWGEMDSGSHMQIQQEKAGVTIKPRSKAELAALVASD